MKTKSKMKTTQAKPLSPIHVGNNVFIRTVTMHFTGRIVGVTDDEILLRDAAWIADSGRFAQAMSTGALNEVEPYPAEAVVSVARGGVIDVSDWLHDLPREVC